MHYGWLLVLLVLNTLTCILTTSPSELWLSLSLACFERVFHVAYSVEHDLLVLLVLNEGSLADYSSLHQHKPSLLVLLVLNSISLLLFAT